MRIFGNVPSCVSEYMKYFMIRDKKDCAQETMYSLCSLYSGNNTVNDTSVFETRNLKQEHLRRSFRAYVEVELDFEK